MLDYAVNSIFRWPIETLEQQFTAQCQMESRKPVERLAAFLGDEQTPEGQPA
jgi:hypothetical protein